jgi:Mrp family chromosome partitioning ATPase
VDLPCPACRARIGNARSSCRICNRFAAQVRRAVARQAIAALDPAEKQTAQRTAELELYPAVVAAFVAEDPVNRSTVAVELAQASFR